MIRITQITDSVGKNRPKCDCYMAHHTHWGDAHRRRAGISTDICSRPAFYRVDNIPMCASHAGQKALAWVVAEWVDTHEESS